MKLTGIAAWAFVTKPKPPTKLKEGRTIPSMYTINLLLDKSIAKELKGDGFNIKKIKEDIVGIEDSAGLHFLQIKKAAEYEGTPTTPPIVVDAKLQPFTGLIGNGSKVTVIFAAKEWDGFGTTGIAASLRKVQILDLVPYEFDEDLEELEEVDGFIAGDVVEDTTPQLSDVDDEIDF